jgi:type II secretory pathway pseudopilin PulG
LRLGDIFKSNYNKFDLARVFGLASPEFFLQSQQQAAAQQQQADLENARTQIRNRMQSGDWREGDIANLQPILTTFPDDNYERVLAEGASDALPSDGASPPLGNLVIATTALVTVVDPNARFRNGALGGIKIRINNPLDESEQGEFVVSVLGNRPALLVYEPEVERQAQQQAGVDPTDLQASDSSQDRQAVENFFASTGDSPNPIFKSFESVRGRGLAGFIRGFNMNIDEKFPWETVGLNNRAPKLVKISMQFDPIHDLQPGLDHNGFNNAPVYNVGSHMKNATRKSQADLAAKETSYRQKLR